MPEPTDPGAGDPQKTTTAETDVAAMAGTEKAGAEGEREVPHPTGSYDAGVGSPGQPWWADLGLKGGVVLALLGLATGVWVYLGLPGWRGQELPGLYEAAKVVVIGVVVAGGAWTARRRARDGDGDGESG